jgi:hypothetical protein
MNDDKAENQEDIRTTVYLPKELHKQIKLFGIVKEMSASEIVREAVKQYMAQKPKRK